MIIFEKGYIDLVLFKNKNMGDNFLIEFKYLKKEDYSENNLKKKYDEAMDELNKYSNDLRINMGNTKRYIIIFIYTEYKIYEV